VQFFLASVLFKFAWTMILPYLLSTLSDLGGHQMMNTTNLMIGAGFALGPVISGMLIESGGFTAMITFSLVTIVASLLCVLVLQRSRRASLQPVA
jgi:predicted MFS family arabinose efflux permease